MHIRIKKYSAVDVPIIVILNDVSQKLDLAVGEKQEGRAGNDI
jgi:hypothetical protein